MTLDDVVASQQIIVNGDIFFVWSWSLKHFSISHPPVHPELKVLCSGEAYFLCCQEPPIQNEE